MTLTTRSVIGLVGCAGSGKSTVAQYLVERCGFRQESFAKALKDCAAAIFGWDRRRLEGETPGDRVWRESVDQWWSARLNITNLTPRWVLQHIGTELMRNEFHDEIWISSLQRRLHSTDGNVVVSDVRFPNEAEAIRSAGGILVRIERRGTVACGHVTETALVGFEADCTLVNDGTLEALFAQVDVMRTRHDTEHGILVPPQLI